MCGNLNRFWSYSPKSSPSSEKWLCNTKKGSLLWRTKHWGTVQMCIIHKGHFTIWSQSWLPTRTRSNCNTNYTFQFSNSSKRYFQRSTSYSANFLMPILLSHSTFSFPLLLAHYSWFLESAADLVVFILYVLHDVSHGQTDCKQSSPARFNITNGGHFWNRRSLTCCARAYWLQATIASLFCYYQRQAFLNRRCFTCAARAY